MGQAPLYAKSDPDASRGLLADLWQGSLQRYVSNDPGYGYRISDDFVKGRTISGTTSPSAAEGWSVADAAEAGGTYSFSTVAGPDGIGRLNSTGTTAQFGAEAQRVTANVVLPSHGSTPRGRVVFQARFDKDDADTIFVGLSESGDNFLSATSQLPTDRDYIGFYTEDNGTVLKFVCANDNNNGTAVLEAITLPVSLITGQNNIGFAVNKDLSVDIVVNSKWLGTTARLVSPLALPIETLTPRLSVTCGSGTTAPTIDVDSVDCFVEND